MTMDTLGILSVTIVTLNVLQIVLPYASAHPQNQKDKFVSILISCTPHHISESMEWWLVEVVVVVLVFLMQVATLVVMQVVMFDTISVDMDAIEKRE